MSRSTQDKVEAALEQAARDYDLEIVADYSYGNRAQVRFEDPEVFDEVALSFHAEYSSAYWAFNDVQPVLPNIGRIDKDGKQFISVWPNGELDVAPTQTQVIKAVRDQLARYRRARIDAEEASA